MRYSPNETSSPQIKDEDEYGDENGVRTVTKRGRAHLRSFKDLPEDSDWRWARAKQRLSRRIWI